MKIILTGSEGMLGRNIEKNIKKIHNVFSFNKNSFDITNFKQTENIFLDIKPDLIINCAAYTDVENAEIEKDSAFLVNSKGAKNVAIMTQKTNSKLIHFSTDYVFDGKKTIPYIANDVPNPINIYGQSKLDGENEIKKHCTNYYIIRTAWLYGDYKNCFVNKIISKIKNNEEIFIVDDETGSPTYVQEISNNIENILKKDFGTYHLVCNHAATRVEMVEEISNILNIKAKITKIKSEQLNLKAKRPKYSVLKSDFPVNDWKISLENYVKNQPLV